MAYKLLRQNGNRLLSRSFKELYNASEEKLRRLYLQRISNFQAIVFSFANLHPKEKYTRYAASVILQWKQVYAEERAFQHRLLYVSDDPAIKNLRDKMAKLRKEYSLQVKKPKSVAHIQKVKQELDKARLEMNFEGQKYKTGLKVAKVNIDQLTAGLSDKSGVIEFRRYSPFDFKTKEFDKPRFAAYLLLSDMEAEQELFFVDVGTLEDIVETMIKSSEWKNRELYTKLLGKFEPHIKNLKKLYIAPDSFLHLISFASLKLPDGRLLTQRQQVNILHSGRDLLSDPPTKHTGLMVAMGGVDYGKTTKVAKKKGMRLALNKRVLPVKQ